jgi:hypothetical protein
MKLQKLLILVTFSGFLAACGGGGSSDCKAGFGAVLGCDKSTPAANTAPVAHAGGNQNVLTGVVVSLNASTSTDAENDPLSYNWRFETVPVGSKAVLVSDTTVQPNFVADVDGVYVVRLVVSDNKLSSSPVLVVVTAAAKNEAPVASAGTNQSVLKGSVVTLDGTASTDPNRNILDFTWTLVSRPQGSAAVLSSSTAIKPTFVADATGTYVVKLRVSDGRETSPEVYTSVVVSESNAAPVAVVSANQNVVTGNTITLDGTGSTDANRDPLTYNWVLTTKPNGSSAVLSSASSPKPAFVADVAGLYVASLKVNDGQVSSDNMAITTVTASLANSAPVAVVSVNQNVVTGNTVTLDGTGSTDANRDPLTYSWVLTTKPNGSAAALSSVSSPNPSFVADVAGLYVASLKVNDGQVSSDNIAITTVTASVVNSAPVAVMSSNQNVLAGALVTLDGTGSTDANRDPLTYNWVLSGKPAGSAAVLSGPNSPKPTFTADLAGTYVASLVVSDGSLTSAVAVGTVTASIVNAAPVAVAGANQSVKLNTLVSLEGRLSYDPNRDVLTYKWVLQSKPAGSAAALSSPTAATPTFTADLAGTYVASLVVSDGQLFSEVVSTTVQASASNAPPVANAGVAQTVKVGATATLDGSGSSDADGSPLTHVWKLAYRPEGSAAALSSTTAAKPTLVPDLPGLYVFTLVVNDGQADSTLATGTLTAVP